MRLSEMKISSRLALAFGLLLLLTVASAGLAVKSLGTLQNDIDDVVRDNNVKVSHVTDMAESIHVVARVMRSIILIDDKDLRERELAKLQKAREDYDRAWEAFVKMDTDDYGKEMHRKIIAARDAGRPLNNKVLELANGGKKDDALKLLVAEANAATNKWQDLLEEQMSIVEADSLTVAQKASSDYVLARNVLIGAAAASLLLSVLTGWLVTRSITAQLGAEPGEAVQLAQNVAQGDLSTRIALKSGDQTSLMAQLDRMQASLADVVGSVRRNAESVATASAQIAQGNQDLSQRTEEQASALQQTAASMEELGSTVVHNANNARQANELATGASQVAQRGGEVVGQVVETMRGITSSSRKIADIIGVIDGIAFQTNILALNAAVEAARAGEQGRGFAVVAGEVRNLAQRSADAAKEIKTLITASVEQVERGTGLVDQAGSTMQEVVDAIGRVSSIMGEIDSASTQQSAGVQQVSEAVGQMDQATQQNAALVEESAAAADSLRQQAQQLVQAVAVFNVSSGFGGASSSPAPASVPAAKSAAPVTHWADSAPAAPKPAPVPKPAATPVKAAAPVATAAPVAVAAASGASDDWETF